MQTEMGSRCKSPIGNPGRCRIHPAAPTMSVDKGPKKASSHMLADVAVDPGDPGQAQVPKMVPIPKPPHPAGLYVLGAAEALERAGFYLLVSLFVLFLNEQMGFKEEQALAWYGNYLGASYFAPLLGGWLASRYLTRQRWVFLGALLMAAGYWLLGSAGVWFMPALVVLVLGNGLFKPNISAELGSLYPEGDSRRDEAFTLFYLAINVGGLAGPLVGELLRERFGWTAAFRAAAIALIASAAVLHLGRRHLQGPKVSSQAERYPENLRARLGALVLLMIGTIPFWLAFQQFGASLSFWIRDHVDRSVHVLGRPFTIPTGWFAASNSFFVLALTPGLAWLFRRRFFKGSAAMSISSPDKFVGGLVCTAASFFWLAQQSMGYWRLGWAPLGVLGFYLLLTIGELLISPVGLSLVSQLAPARWAPAFFGLWFLATALGNWLAGKSGVLYARWLPHDFFAAVAAVVIAMALLLMTQLSWLRRTLPRQEGNE